MWLVWWCGGGRCGWYGGVVVVGVVGAVVVVGVVGAVVVRCSCLFSRVMSGVVVWLLKYLCDNKNNNNNKNKYNNNNK